MFVPPRYSEAEARAAIEASRSYAEALRRLGMCSTGGGSLILKKYARIWSISVDHFDPHAASLAGLARTWSSAIPLEELLVDGGFTQGARLKDGLYEAGLKAPPASCAVRGRNGAGGAWP